MSVTSTERAKLGYGLGKEEGEAFWVLGMLETIKIGGEDTAGEYGLVEIVARKGDGSPWHVHHEEDEWFYVLDGEFTVYVADARLSLTPGSFAFGPKGVPHTFIAETEGATVLVGFQPFQFEGFMREAGEPAEERVLPPPPETAGHGAAPAHRGKTRVRHPRPAGPTPWALATTDAITRKNAQPGRATPYPSS